ncbi:MAG: trans-splicing intein-formed DNA polymerase III subunit alpha C-terminal partner DnaE-C, partial [Clostridia bacterium]|nr:trans-splicing intein-formed DNA polymerase III subunit alpha C-terminal partner DnaE-C [Clostridia bacterium]
MEEIEKERAKNGEFTSFVDFCERVDSKCLNKKTLESLIKSGAFANIEDNRKKLLMNIDNVVNYVQKTNKNKDMGQKSLFD